MKNVWAPIKYFGAVVAFTPSGAIVGRVMKASQGKADGKIVTAIMQSRRPSA